jgi:NAD(P)H-dependent FMN reductase
MSILTLSGSPAPDSANSRLLRSLSTLTDRSVVPAPDIAALPLYQPNRDRAPVPEAVLAYRRAVTDARAVVVCTPAYLHNLPAVLKNALEWLTTSGELYDKPVLVLTFTPHPPRGERARQSLLWSLEALNARVVAEVGLYQSETPFGEDGQLLESETRELLYQAMQLLPR